MNQTVPSSQGNYAETHLGGLYKDWLQSYTCVGLGFSCRMDFLRPFHTSHSIYCFEGINSPERNSFVDHQDANSCFYADAGSMDAN